MKKVLFACDGRNFSDGAFEFLSNLHEKDPVLATGMFFSSVDYSLLLGTASYALPYELIDFDAEERLLEETIETFERKCQLNGIEFRVHKERAYWTLDDIQKETRFADLAIVSEEAFFRDIDNEQPNKYLEDLLRRAECPVMMVPENSDFPQKLLLAYDARQDSMFAMKQFCYLLPSLCNLEAEVVYLREEEDNEIPDLEYLEEYASRHFNDLKFTKLHFDSKEGINRWLVGRTNTLVVTGSYGRSTFSSLFRKSFVKGLIKDHQLPIFLAHN